MMVILEMLARAYGNERDPDTYAPRGDINHEAVFDLAVQAYELGLGIRQPSEALEVRVGHVSEIPEGERKIIQVEGLSIGVFHHKGAWIALRNSCLHRGGPVCTGALNGEILICPWHGYQYNLLDGKLLADPSAALEKYQVEVRDDQVFLHVPLVEKEVVNLVITEGQPEKPAPQELQENEFLTADVPPGKTTLVYVDDEPVGVFNAGGTFYAIQNACTHAEGTLEGVRITCPWHGSVFDVTTGKVLHGPATQPVKTYQVLLEGGTGRVEER
jgi:nitrite reductase (NADH) small subunit